MIGLTADQRLIRFRRTQARPCASSIGYVTGLAGDTALVGIDFRVQDRQPVRGRATPAAST